MKNLAIGTGDDHGCKLEHLGDGSKTQAWIGRARSNPYVMLSLGAETSKVGCVIDQCSFMDGDCVLSNDVAVPKGSAFVDQATKVMPPNHALNRALAANSTLWQLAEGSRFILFFCCFCQLTLLMPT